VALLLERQRDHRHGPFPLAAPGQAGRPVTELNSLEKAG
jgi:hypothetical protein